MRQLTTQILSISLKAKLQKFSLYIIYTILDIFEYTKKGITFALPISVLLPAKIAHRSLVKEQFLTQDNTPPMPLLDAHLGGFLILRAYG